MKSFDKFLLLAISLATMIADAGPLLLSNSKGFDSNPIVASTGAYLTGGDPVLVAVGTFASEPGSLLAGASNLIGTQRYAALMAEFTGYGNPVGLEASTPPLARRGTFSFQGTQTVGGTPLANKPVYIVIAKGASLAAATEVAILKTGATFQAADDESALPKLVTVGTSAGSVVIVGAGSRFTAVPTALSSTARPAYSLAEILPVPQLVVEPPAGLVLPGGNGSADFGAVELGGSSAAAVFTIRNTGDAELTTLALQVDAPGNGEFLLDTTATSASVAPGDATTFTLRFAPTLAGLRNANLTITSNDASRNPHEWGQLSPINISSPVNGVSSLRLTFHPRREWGQLSPINISSPANHRRGWRQVVREGANDDTRGRVFSPHRCPPDPVRPGRESTPCFPNLNPSHQ